MTPPRTAHRHPQARVTANTQRILDAAERTLIDEGWPELTPTAIARAAGMSQRAVQSRFHTRGEIATALWNDRYDVALQELLTPLLASAALAPDGTSTSLAESLTDCASPHARGLEAMELLLLAPFEQPLAEAVSHGLGTRTDSLCRPRQGGISKTLSAQRAYLLALGLGLIAVSPLGIGVGLTFEVEAQILLEAIDSGQKPSRLPSRAATHFRRHPDLGTGDPALEALLQATLDEIGSKGFDGATTRGITREAGYTEGLLFGRYASKLDLFLDASRLQIAAGFSANEQFMEALAQQHGRGISEAVLMRELSRREFAALRTITLEQLRVAWRNPDLRSTTKHEVQALVTAMAQQSGNLPGAFEHYYAGYALGIGILILARLFPDSYALSWDVMSVPLNNGPF